MAERRGGDERDEPAGGARRGTRRAPGTPQIGPLGARRQGAGGTGRGGISEARAYTPRGRTVRETGADRPTDPHRPALRLVDGGGPADPSARSRLGSSSRSATPARSGASARTASSTRGGAYTRKAPSRATTADRGATATRRGGTGRSAAARRTPGRAVDLAGFRQRLATQRRGRPRRVLAPLPAFQPGQRLRAGSILVLVIFLILGGRLVLLQLTDGRAYAAKGLQARLTTTVLEAQRGSIVDRYGNVLAQSLDARAVFADPTRVVNPAQTAARLRDLLGIPVSELLPKLTRSVRADGQPDEFEYLARGVAPSIAASVKALDLPGIGTVYDQTRDDPGHDLAANLIGFTGTDRTGLGGLELAFDKQLAGVNGSHTYEVGDGDLSTQLPGGIDEQTPARPGSSLRLTIDRDLQFKIQQLLFDHMTSAHADFGAAVVMDPHTGEVLAQASFPTFDAQQWQNYPASSRVDAATQITVDPGSVAKLITVAGALQEGIITPDSTETIGPSINKGGTTFHDDHPFPRGTTITIPGILAFSSNVGTITIAGKLGAAKLYEYQKRFGLGQPTREGLPGESSGLVQPPQNWSGSSYGSIPIGMGIAVTPLQMTAAYAAIANGGVWVQPHLIGGLVGPDGKVTAAPAPASHQVVTPQVATQLRTLFLAPTTVPGATGRSAAVTGYLVAGKTGTGGQVANGQYRTGSVVSFVGMAPADNPRYVIGVFAHVPDGTGGSVGAPTFHDMMQFTLQHFGVPPTGAVAPRFRVTVK